MSLRFSRKKSFIKFSVEIELIESDDKSLIYSGDFAHVSRFQSRSI